MRSTCSSGGHGNSWLFCNEAVDRAVAIAAYDDDKDGDLTTTDDENDNGDENDSFVSPFNPGSHVCPSKRAGFVLYITKVGAAEDGDSILHTSKKWSLTGFHCSGRSSSKSVDRFQAAPH